MPNGVPMSWLRTSYDHPPLFVAEGKGARFRDADGHEYSDFNIADMSMFAGTRRNRWSRPSPDASRRERSSCCRTRTRSWVAEELARRYGLPKWQFTLSATHANTEVIRVARALTGRDKVLFFDGKYHGHFDEALVDLQDGTLVPEEGGPAARRHVQDEDRAVQRPRWSASRPRATRRRHRDHGTDDDEQRRAADARRPGSTTRSARSHGRRAPCWRTTRRIPRSWVPAGSRGCGRWSPTS